MTLSRAQAKLVYACEWNPHAIEALRHNLQSNSVADRCILLEGDNRNTAPKVYWYIVYLFTYKLWYVLTCLLPFICGYCQPSRNLNP
jgi:tRNA G37 N-methylase Trm5